MPKDSKSRKKSSPSKSAMVMLEPEERPVDSEADTDVDEEESEDDDNSLPDLDEEDSPVLPPVAKRARYFSTFFLPKIRKNYICFFFAEDESILTMNPHP